MAEAKKIKTESRVIHYDTDGEITTEYIEYAYYPVKEKERAWDFLTEPYPGGFISSPVFPTYLANGI